MFSVWLICNSRLSDCFILVTCCASLCSWIRTSLTPGKTHHCLSLRPLVHFVHANPVGDSCLYTRLAGWLQRLFSFAALLLLPDAFNAPVNVHCFFVWLEFKSSLVTLNRRLIVISWTYPTDCWKTPLLPDYVCREPLVFLSLFPLPSLLMFRQSLFCPLQPWGQCS